MCKLSLNIVPNVYNSLQGSFLSPAWPWSGGSFPKGNQWEWWDPGMGPLPGLGEVGHSPGETSGSAGTLDWGPMWSGSQPICHPQCPYTTTGPLMPYTPDGPWYPPDTPTPQWPPSAPTLSGSPNASMTPPTPPAGLLMPLHSLPVPNTPWCPLHLCWPLSPYSLTAHNALLTCPSPPVDPVTPHTPYWLPNAPWCPYTPLSLSTTLPASSPMYPWHPLHLLLASWHPYTLLVQASSGQQWYYCRSAWHVISLWILYLW